MRKGRSIRCVALICAAIFDACAGQFRCIAPKLCRPAVVLQKPAIQVAGIDTDGEMLEGAIPSMHDVVDSGRNSLNRNAVRKIESLHRAARPKLKFTLALQRSTFGTV